MIAHLNGTVAGISPDGAVIDVGGVGLRVQCTPDTLASLKPGEAAWVATSLIVREDSLTLFGFGTDDERNVFELLQTASGIGPRLALAMLAVHSPDALRRAVAAEDLNTLIMVPGIGRKGAQRIVLELKDRLGAPGDFAGNGHPPARQATPSWRDQVQSGLVNLGWSARDAEAAIAAVEAESDGALGALGALGELRASVEPGTAGAPGAPGAPGALETQGAPDVATVLRAALRKLSKS